MDRRDFIKKATMAAAGAAVVSPVSAMLDNVTGKKCKVYADHAHPRHQHGLSASEDPCRRPSRSPARRTPGIHELYQVTSLY
ncbi:MAG: twin-arginine translocation signal domain-containing protein [Prevotella sp.]|nr:twin-arginine translocation signal domain-containing protein [Prevotella sp.]